jgi:tRNA-modifying protein YgfZ
MTAIAVTDLDPASPDGGAVAHYGDPMREQRLLTEAVGLVDRSHRVVLQVSGEDRLSWLHSLTTQHVSALRPLHGTELVVLSPHGHVEHHALMIDDGSVSWLDLEPASSLLTYLERMRFMLRVEPADVSADWAVFSLVGPGTDDALSALGVGPLPPPDVLAVPGPKFAAGSVPPRPSSEYGVVAALGGLIRRVPGGADLLLPRGVVPDLGVPMAGIWAYEAVRVAARRPRLGFETDHRTLPSEAGWTPAAVHLDKGCYRGQETVARVHHLGRPPRKLVLLHLDGVTSDQLPARGTPVSTVDGRQVGFVGTAVHHYELGQIALALVKQNVPSDAPLRVADSAASIDP